MLHSNIKVLPLATIGFLLVWIFFANASEQSGAVLGGRFTQMFYLENFDSFWQQLSEGKPIQGQSITQRRSQNSLLSELTKVITNNFGSKVRVITDTRPFYLLGDFNGDGFKDIAILVDPDGAQQELKQNGVKYLDVEPSSDANGRELDLDSAKFQYCLGVAIIHGTRKGWNSPTPKEKYLFYECFIPFRLIPSTTRIRRRYRSVKETPPKLKGDAIYLYLERDAASIVYWTGKTYKGYYQ